MNQPAEDPPNKNRLEFYLTPEHECPYLDDRRSKTVFLNPELIPDVKIYNYLIDKGFRRSGEHVYRPHCEGCQACISVRLDINKFMISKQQRRCKKKGKKFTTRFSPAAFDTEHYRLFESYINARHSDGDMYPPSEKQYREFVLCKWLNTQFLDFIDPTTGKLIACCVFDELPSGLSAVYTFFDNDYAKFSLGRLAVLQLIEESKHKNLSYVYLGYWVKNCQKMSYKGEYRPLECFVQDRWIVLN